MSPEPQPRTVHAAALFALVSLVYFLPGWWPGTLLYGTDYLAGGYAFDVFTSLLLRRGELPTWVPHIFGGLPLFANPGSAFHPVHVLAALMLPVNKVLVTVLTVQMAVGGMGMFLLTRELGVREWVALVAGLSFQLTGLVLSWVYAGHDGRIIVATMAPLVLACLHRALCTGSMGALWGLAASLGVALLSFQIQTAWYLLLASALWTGAVLVGQRRLVPVRQWFQRGMRVMAAVALAFCVAALNFLPFQDYVAASPRGAAQGRGVEYATSYSASPQDLLGMAVPDAVGSSVVDPESGALLFPPYRGPNPVKLHTEYLGVFPWLMLAAGMVVMRRRAWWAVGALALFFLTLALGGHTPLYRVYLATLPGLMKFRAPDLATYVVALLMVVMAALTAERLASLQEESGRRLAVGVAWGVGLVTLLLGAAWSLNPAGWLRFALGWTVLGGVLAGWLVHLLPTRWAVAVLVLGVVADQGMMGRRFLHLTPQVQAHLAPDDVAQYLSAQTPPSRTWVLPAPDPYRGAGNDLMRFGLDQAGGEHPVPLQRYLEYVGTSTQRMLTWDNLASDAAFQDGVLAFTPGQARLDGANIRHIVSSVPLQVPGWRMVLEGRAGFVYENARALPRAYLVPRVTVVADGQASLAGILSPGWDPRQVAFVETTQELGITGHATRGDAEITERTSTRVGIRAWADAAVMLVLAENHHDGWTATVDGREVPVFFTNHTFRGVVLPPGEHFVRFEFRPVRVTVGLAISVAAWMLLAMGGVGLLVQRRRTDVSP